MAKKKSITRISDKKRGRPKIRFSIWGLILIFMISFSGCFIIYMVAANINENFWSDEFDKVVTEKNRSKVPNIDDGADTGNEAEEMEDTQEVKTSVINPIAQSEAKDQSYLSSCCLITDSSLLEIDKYTGLKDVIGSEALSAAGCNTVTIESSYGNKTAYEILQVKKPEKVYIMLGSDIFTSSVDDMIESYTDFVKNVRGYLSTADIYIMQLPPISGSSNATSSNIINEFNTKLLTVANLTGVYCLDTNTALKGVDGNISEEFTDKETGKLNEKAYKKIVEYILCHTV
ncbi:hypothetical protein [Ruminococcus sp.]|uniref:hypothetical protein n=1 Tax=Ruminococcus sp. TaxID=41978 RepID=UPI001B712D3E|nr:hypothetical protein [Ruminococcus sp.]MBP5430982.1 hypothetical protein [Ruminococcus sp.]